jgi:hypothetical protein
VLIAELRRVGLKGTELENAQVDTIRCRLLKIGARTRLSVRRFWVSLSSAHPMRHVFVAALRNIEEGLPRLLTA